ncbi:MAG: hypothetical protein JWM33_429, partial [Caulobacteraceae bacterium]|nr:hypothetical protein [Caulobacteraceae bacterium]
PAGQGGRGGAAAATRAPAPPPTDGLAIGPIAAAAPSVTLTNGLVTARVYTPGLPNSFYRGTRFDNAGVVGSLTYKGHEYYSLWFTKTSASTRDFVYDGNDIISGPNTSVTGPMEEFDNSKPPGWDAAPPGGLFLKIGVGMLRKPASGGAYTNFLNYELADGGTRTTKSTDASVTFTQTINDTYTGYGYVYEKTLRLVPGQPQLLIQHSLKNTGKQAIATTLYDHNFLSIDHQTLSQALNIKAPFAIKADRPIAGGKAEFQEGRIVYTAPLTDRDRVTTPIQGFGATSSDYDFTVTNAAGVGVRFTGDKPLDSAALWSVRSVVAVEPFIKLAVEPGATVNWTYTYTYLAP